MRFSLITSTYNQLNQLIRCYEHIREQSYKDFEWIIADDGSSDGTREWAEKLIHENSGKLPLIQYVSQEDNGYRLVEILNKAGVVASGEYLVWVMGDSYPKEDFLERLNEVVEPDRMVNGIRIQVDREGKVIGHDWRLDRVAGEFDNVIEFQLPYVRGWELMTLNSMCMPRKIYEEMGGIYPGYKGYGRMDWDMAAYCKLVAKMGLWWAPQAIIYHEQHPEREDTGENIELFHKRLEEFRGDDESVKRKMDYIMSPERAEEKKKMIAEVEAERIRKQHEMEREDRE